MYKNKIKLWHSHFETALVVVLHKKCTAHLYCTQTWAKEKIMLLQHRVLFKSLLDLAYDSTVLKQLSRPLEMLGLIIPPSKTTFFFSLWYHMSPVQKWKAKMNRCTMSINRHLHKKTCRARSCGRRITYAEPRRIGHTLAFQYSTYIVPLRCALDHNFRLLLYHMQRPARGWHAHPSYFCFSMSNTGKKKNSTAIPPTCLLFRESNIFYSVVWFIS